MKELSAEKLLEAIQSLRGEENKVLAELILYLSEVYTRRAYAELGYSSLFSFCREALGYSEGAAWRRVSAAKLLLDMPELYEKIAEGELSLCAISEIARVKELDKRQALTLTAAGKSKREVQSLVAEALPAQIRRKRAESVRASEIETSPVSLPFTSCPSNPDTSEASQGVAEVQREKVYTLTLELTEQEMREVEELQRLLGARRIKDTLLTSARKHIQREKRRESLREKRLQAKAAEALEQTVQFPPVETHSGEKSSRYIPADVEHAVQKRDQCQCTFVAADGKRCSETRNLQFDHVRPHALCGKSSVENLRLLCPAHNKLEAEKVFGEAAIRRLVQFKQNERLTGSAG
jgi:5-methylcytosine-specific restriction endonuclease McrA